jgi:hypothetical protein
MDELWKEYREDQKERRLERLPIRVNQIMSLIEFGYKVEKKTEYQFRINDIIDVYPIHNSFHDITKNKRGGYKDVIQFVKKYLK